MTLTFPDDGTVKLLSVQRRLNVFAVWFKRKHGREAKEIDLLRELRRMGYEAYLTDDEEG